MSIFGTRVARPDRQNAGGSTRHESSEPPQGATSAPARHGTRSPLPASEIPELVRAASTQPASAAPPATEWPPSSTPNEQFSKVSGPPRALRHGEGSRRRTDVVGGFGNNPLSAGTVILDLGGDTTPSTRKGSDEAPVSPEQIERTRRGINGWFVAVLLGLAAIGGAHVVRQRVAANVDQVLSGEAGFSFTGKCTNGNLQGALEGNGAQVHIEIDVRAGEGRASMPALKNVPFTQPDLDPEILTKLIKHLVDGNCLQHN